MLNFDEKKERLFEYFDAQNQIVAVWLIGSYGTAAQHQNSDIDFAILFAPNIERNTELVIESDICEILNTDKVDVVNAFRAPILLRARIIDTGKMLVSKDDLSMADFVEQTLTYYYDEIISREKYNREYRAA